jgi:hypothetical protein
MVDVTKIDHRVEGLGRLPAQWDDSPVLRSLISSWMGHLNTLEDQAIDVRDAFNVNTAIGTQLDMLGGFLNEGRQGRSDDDYRDALITLISSSNGSGNPDQLMDLFASLTGTDDLKYYEHYPFSVAMLATSGTLANKNHITNVAKSTAAVVEVVGLMYDPFGYAWYPAPSSKIEKNLITNVGDQIITDTGDEIVVLDNQTTDANSSVFVDSTEAGTDGVGYGLGWGAAYGGSPDQYSQLVDTVVGDNSLVVTGGNGYILWAEQETLDIDSGTSNKAVPIQQYRDSGILEGQPLPRQFFNWMMAKIDDWLSYFGDRTPVGAIKYTVNGSWSESDYETRFGGTWVYNGTYNTTAGTTLHVFERTA